MFTKLLLCCAVAAILGIATESSARPYEITKLEPIISGRQIQGPGDTYEIYEVDLDKYEQQHQPQPTQTNQCQQYMSYYDNYYKTEYSKYYDKYYKETYDKYYNNYWSNYWRNYYANEVQIPDTKMGKDKVEWVCRNPKTKEAWVIGSRGPGQTPNSQLPDELQNFPPIHGGGNPPHQGGETPNKPEPPTDPQQNGNNPSPNNQGNPTSTPEPETETHNTNGEGIIDIRFGDR